MGDVDIAEKWWEMLDGIPFERYDTWYFLRCCFTITMLSDDTWYFLRPKIQLFYHHDDVPKKMLFYQFKCLNLLMMALQCVLFVAMVPMWTVTTTCLWVVRVKTCNRYQLISRSDGVIPLRYRMTSNKYWLIPTSKVSSGFRPIAFHDFFQ